MGSIQMLLVIGGLALLGVLMLIFFSSSGAQHDTKYSNEAVVTATGLGQSLIQEIAGKAFDENTVLSPVSKTTNLSSILGKETGETNRSLFDDIDDFNNYADSVALGSYGEFNYKIKIQYAQKFNPDIVSLARTFTKRADFYITNSYLKDPGSNKLDTLKLTYIYTY